MRTICRVVSLGIVCGIFGAGCVGNPVTDERSGTIEQSLANSFRETTYYSGPDLSIPVGECYSASICTSATLVCSGTQTSFSTVELFPCN